MKAFMCDTNGDKTNQTSVKENLWIDYDTGATMFLFIMQGACEDSFPASANIRKEGWVYIRKEGFFKNGKESWYDCIWFNILH